MILHNTKLKSKRTHKMASSSSSLSRYRKKRKVIKRYIFGLIVLLLILHVIIFGQYLKYRRKREHKIQQKSHYASDPLMDQNGFVTDLSVSPSTGVLATPKEEEPSLTIGGRYAQLIREGTPSNRAAKATIAYGECVLYPHQ